LILVGGFFAALFLGLARQWLYRRADRSLGGVLVIGFDPVIGLDPIVRPLARSLGHPIMGVIGAPASSLPPDIPVLGELSQIEEILEHKRPSQILVAAPDWASKVPPSMLLRHRLRGVPVTHVGTAYENLFERVYCRNLYPAEMLL